MRPAFIRVYMRQRCYCCLHHDERCCCLCFCLCGFYKRCWWWEKWKVIKRFLRRQMVQVSHRRELSPPLLTSAVYIVSDNCPLLRLLIGFHQQVQCRPCVTSAFIIMPATLPSSRQPHPSCLCANAFPSCPASLPPEGQASELIKGRWPGLVNGLVDKFLSMQFLFRLGCNWRNKILCHTANKLLSNSIV